MKVVGYVLALLVSVVLSLPAGEPEEKWYALGDDMVYVSDFFLAAGQGRAFTVKVTNEQYVGFFSDCSGEQVAESHRKAFGQNRSENYEFPIRLIHVPTQRSFGSLIGGGMPFTPVQNKLDMMITNSGPESFRVVIWAKPKRQPEGTRAQTGPRPGKKGQGRARAAARQGKKRITN